jgi:F-type H+-transporting ATPase subunit b
MLQDPRLWILIAFIATFVLFGRKLTRAGAKALDARSAKIAAELEQAEAIRAEAEALLASYTQKSKDSLREAEAIIAEARKQAEAMIANAEAQTKDHMQKRIEQMNKRLDDEEKLALEQVRNHVVDITIAAAKSLVSDHFRTMSGDEMVRYVVTDMERQIH